MLQQKPKPTPSIQPMPSPLPTFPILPYYPYSHHLHLFPILLSVSALFAVSFFGSCFQFLRPYMTLSCTCFYASLLWVEVQCFLQLVFARAVDTHLHFLASVQRAIRSCRDSCCASMTDDEHMMLHRGNYCTSPAVHRCARWRTCTPHALTCLTGGGQMPGEHTASGQSCESRHAFPYV